VRDVQDIVFIFFALAIGMSCGVGLHVIAIASTVLISFIAVVLVTFNFGVPRKQEFLLQISYAAAGDIEENIHKILRKYAGKFKLVNLKKLGEENLEAFYQVGYKTKKNSGALLNELRTNPGVLNVNLFFDDDDSDHMI
jgi:uncharacterized membrane protein YhiD involved in acid resistance